MARAMLAGAARGFLAGALCVLPLYQGFWQALADAGLVFEPYPARGVPLILGLMAAGGVLGAVLRTLRGAARPAGVAAETAAGAALGTVAALAMWFGMPPSLGREAIWDPLSLAHALTVFAGWGVLTGLALRWRPGDGFR